MATTVSSQHDNPLVNALLKRDDAYVRADESDDAHFYSVERLVQHLDRRALETVETLIDHLVTEPKPDVLDLMASFDSHLSLDRAWGRVVGLGMNDHELKRNPVLTESVIHDLNRDPKLPFKDASFDVVLNTLSIQYLTDPISVFREAARVLRPGGLFLVVFSNRQFESKAVRIWQMAMEDERICLVRHYFREGAGFRDIEEFVSMGAPRPNDDKYAVTGLPSDPVFALFAEKAGGAPGMFQRGVPDLQVEAGESNEHPQRIKGGRPVCPHCGQATKLWAISDNPYSTWDHDLYVCVNDACPYLVRGWKTMFDQGNMGVSYRLTIDPQTGATKPIPVPHLNAIKDELRD